MKFVILFFLITSVAFASENIKKVKEGMNEDEVVAILGEPTSVHVDENKEKTYLYDSFLIGFKKNKVYDILNHGI
jgi:hypothetical protein